jgi:hypothetical protein
MELKIMANVKFCASFLYVTVPPNMTQVGFNKIVSKIRGYLKKNWGSPFIVGVMLLLLSAAVSLSAGLSSLADSIAVYAYYALVAGVFLQLASFLKYCKKSCDGEVAV